MQGAIVCCSVLQCDIHVLQCVAVCCSVEYSVLQRGMHIHIAPYHYTLGVLHTIPPLQGM